MVALPTCAADLPRARALPPAIVTPYAPIGPAVPVVPVLPVPQPSADLVATVRFCAPGYAVAFDGICKRTDHLEVQCATSAGPCRPLPPDPLPYGIGPALRLNY